MRLLIEEGFSKGNLDIVDEIVSSGSKEHQYISPNHPDGPEGVKMVINFCRNLFPDFTLTINDMVAVEDKVWMRGTGHGTHGGAFLGRPPTGREATVDVIDICRFENGKMVEHWGVPDRFHMLIQLGLIPAQPGAPA
jgi:predicted ester cyclase